jgi:L,D-peptidoglycan transpeptidase YkuD (ErfK/YbiS/YcfS/YnhG family)
MIRARFLIAGCAVLAASAGCAGPPVPPEVKAVQHQERRLWETGAPRFFPDEYQWYLKEVRWARDRFLHQQGRIPFLRDFDGPRLEHRQILLRGGRLLGRLREMREAEGSQFGGQYARLEGRVSTIREVSRIMNEGRLASRNLTKAELALAEARSLQEGGRHGDAMKAIFEAEVALKSAEAALSPIVRRYSDRSLLNLWSRWVAETVSDSRERGSLAIVVSKAHRTLTVYRAGRQVACYQVGLGRNGLNDKLFSGDQATPEGKYHVIKKVPNSRYYLALLINYPNEDDRRQYQAAKRKGIVPARAGIGGLVEIHGGGDEGMTLGCIALDDAYMEQIYRMVDVGTPVTIVGASDGDNPLSKAFSRL